MSKVLKKFARISKTTGRVEEIFSGVKLFPMTPELKRTWIEAPEEVEEGWQFDGIDFHKPIQNNIHIFNEPPVDLIKESIDSLKEKAKDMEKSIKSIEETKINNNDIKKSLKDINEGLVACKGFLMMIPDLNKSIEEIKEILKTNKGEKK